MKAAIIAVGSELLDPLRRETNGAYLTARLREIGVEVFARTCVADDGAWLEAAFREALSRADVVIATGGLGPTEDDLTRDSAARAVGRPLRRDEGILEWLRARFAKFNRVMAPVNEKQADVIEGASVLPNARGTAPGPMARPGRPPAVPAAGASGRDAAHVRRPGAPHPARARGRPRPQDARAAHRVDGGERRRAGRGPALQDVREPAHDHPGRRRARRSCT